MQLVQFQVEPHFRLLNICVIPFYIANKHIIPFHISFINKNKLNDKYLLYVLTNFILDLRFSITYIYDNI